MNVPRHNKPKYSMKEILQNRDPRQADAVRKKMLLAKRINDRLMETGMKQKELADRLNKNQSEISKWLSGTHNFTVETLFDIERILYCELIRCEDPLRQNIIVYQSHISNLSQMSELDLENAPNAEIAANVFEFSSVTAGAEYTNAEAV